MNGYAKKLNQKGFGVIEGVLSTALATVLIFFISMQIQLQSIANQAQIHSISLDDTRKYVRENLSCANTLTDAVKAQCTGNDVNVGNYVALIGKDPNLTIAAQFDPNALATFIGENISLRARCATDTSGAFYKIKVEVAKFETGFTGLAGANAFATNPLTKQQYAWLDLTDGIPLTCEKNVVSVPPVSPPPPPSPVSCLDNSFGTGGIVTRHLHYAINVGSSVNVQLDGKIVVAGYDRAADDDLGDILRFNPDGTVDTTYGGAGLGYRRMRIHANAEHTFLYHSALQSDGKILAVGHNRYGNAENGSNIDACDAVTMVRLNVNGTPDASFTGDGIINYNPHSNEQLDEFGYGGILQQSDGKIVVSGTYDTQESSPDDQYDSFVSRFNVDGTMDTSFNGTGKVLKDLKGGNQDEYIRGMALQQDNKIIMVGQVKNTNYDVLLWRVNSNGANDASFGSAGVVETVIGSGHDSARAVALQGDGKILVVGVTQVGLSSQWFIARYLPANGALDTSFNGTGIKVISNLSTKSGDVPDPTSKYQKSANRVGQLPNGKIIVSGSAYNGSNYDMAVAVLNIDGTLDTTFNSTGTVFVPVGSYDDYAMGLAIKSDGKVVLSGQRYSTSGETNSDFAVVQLQPTACSSGGSPAPTTRKIAVSNGFSCSIAGGAAKCWGVNQQYTLGSGSLVFDSVVPVAVSGLASGASDISAAAHSACAVVNGAGKCWGGNGGGQLGNNSTTNSAVPVNVMGLGVGVSQVAQGTGNLNCMIQNGAAKCWGSNNAGQLGNGTLVGSLVPVQVSGLTSGVTQIAVGDSYACAVHYGAAKCWGHNGTGGLGDGTTVSKSVPVQVTGLTSGVTEISASGSSQYSCALVNGGMKCWGGNARGQLGNGTTTSSTVPINVQGLSSGVTRISVGVDSTCAIASGAAKCWGANNYGKLGNNSTVDSRVPVTVQGFASGVQDISTSGTDHACLVTEANRVYCWGYNNNGGLGNNSRIQSLVPVLVNGY